MCDCYDRRVVAVAARSVFRPSPDEVRIGQEETRREALASFQFRSSPDAAQIDQEGDEASSSRDVASVQRT